MTGSDFERDDMTSEIPDGLKKQLNEAHQEHLLRDWERLDESGREHLQWQIEAIDFPLIADLSQRQLQREQSGSDKADTQALRDMASRSGSPGNLIRLRETDDAVRNAARATGERLLHAGKVGAILVAGGQGTRLGFPHPKGMFPIGPVSDRTLFRLFADQLLVRMARAGVTIPYFIMTSDATHEETIAFFREQNFLGLNPDDVYFFQQASLPAVDAATGRILFDGIGQIALSPDGHGGMLAAMQRVGLFEQMKQRGIEHLYYHQVDNAATIVCDPVFLGLHDSRESEMSTKVVAKTSGQEPMGVVVGVDGGTRIIEYSDLPEDLACETDDRGDLRFWAGSTAIHAFRVDFLERMSRDADSLPYHIARKKVAHIDEAGNPVQPAFPNAWKFERFIFDILPRAKNALVMEVDRATEFLPVKNEKGTDSPDTARAGLRAIAHNWLREAGVECTAEVPVEISPLYALDCQEFCAKASGTPGITQATVFEQDKVRIVE